MDDELKQGTPHFQLNGQFLLVRLLVLTIFLAFAIGATMIVSQITGPGPVPQPAASSTSMAESTTELVRIRRHGGLCPTGPCGSETIITVDGKIVGAKEHLSSQGLADLREAIDTADFVAIKARPFTRMCPTDYDGQETIFTFTTEQGTEKLPSCTYDLTDVQLIDLVYDLLEKAQP